MEPLDLLETNAEALPDTLLGRIMALVGREHRRALTLTCKRWRRVFYNEPALWRSFRLASSELAATYWEEQDMPLTTDWYNQQLSVMHMVGRFAADCEVRGIGPLQLVAAETGHPWRLADVLLCLNPGVLRRLALCCELEPSSGSKYHLYGQQSLGAAAIRQLARLRQLEDLALDSWQLPHGTAAAISQLAHLQAVRLRTRQLPQHCLASLLSLTRLTRLELHTSMPLPPLQQLSRLTLLQHLELCQWNCVGTVMALPPISSLPNLTSYTFHHSRGPVQVEGGQVRQCSYTAAPKGGNGPELAIHFSVFLQPPASMQRLLDSLVPAGMQLARLEL